MKMPQRLVTLINWSFDHYWNLITGLFFAFLSYFAELKGAFHVMFAAFMLDLFLGIIVSKAIRKERFSMKKLFVAFERMVIAYALVMLLYAMDKEMHQDTVDLADTAAWLISGFLAYGAADNGFKLTGGILFLNVKKFIRKKFQDNTGIDIEENPN
jgi:hypothetical protein